MNNLIININKILKKTYPVEIEFDKINTLSHFWILSNDFNKFFTINMNIDGIILNGQYKNYQIVKVITTEIINWYKYLLLYVSFLNQSRNPCVAETQFIYLLHTYNYIDILNIKKLLIKHKDDKTNNHIIEYEIDYTDKPNYKLPWYSNIQNYDIINKDNHFYLEDFCVNNNYEKLKIEIDRLIANRDKYKTIHFHLNNNGGGDIVPAHLILRCLVGKKENWMKGIKKIMKIKKIEKTTKTKKIKKIKELDCFVRKKTIKLKDITKNLKIKNIEEWNCWEEENKDSPNYDVIKKLNLDNLPNYDTKYNGKIYLYMDTCYFFQSC